MKKKILIISTSLYGGGAEKVLVTLLRNIDYSLYEIHLNLEYDYGMSFEPIPKDVKVSFRYRDTEDWRSKIDYHLYSLLGINLFEPNRIKNVVDSEYDAIISFIEGKPLKYHRYVANRTRNNITWVHADLLTNHYTIGKTFTPKHETEAYKLMNKVVFVSNNAKEQYENIFGVGTTNNYVLYNPIDKDGILQKARIHVPEICKNKTTLVAVGRLSKEKGFDRLLRVVHMLNTRGYEFDMWIVGDGAMKEELLEYKRNNGLTNVTFWGFQNPPYPWFIQADIFVSASYTEAAPITICEAMTLGIPVVATKTAGAMELLEDGKWGLLSDHGDDSLFETIASLLDSPKMLSEYKNRAIKRSSIWGIENSLKQFYKLISNDCL